MSSSIFKGTKAASGNGDIPDPVPAGSHPAVLVAIIDMGTQQFQFQNQDPEWARKVYLCWECSILSDAGTVEKTQMIGREYRLSFHPKAGLMDLIQSWRGKPYAEGEEVDLTKLLGQVCALNVSHSDKGYAKVESAAKLMAGVHRPKPSVSPFIWSLGEPTGLIPTWVPFTFGKNIVTVIQGAKENQGKPSDEESHHGKSATQLNTDMEEHFVDTNPIAF